tara:strand:+ start:656 stop:817 length:162 start_codon:yes stop_codon:yes gene_type:complete
MPNTYVYMLYKQNDGAIAYENLEPLLLAQKQTEWDQAAFATSFNLELKATNWF